MSLSAHTMLMCQTNQNENVKQSIYFQICLQLVLMIVVKNHLKCIYI